MAMAILDRAFHRTLKLPRRWARYRSALRYLRSRAVAIVMYHGVTREALPVFNWCQLAAGDFEQQLEWLSHSYAVLPLKEVLARIRRHAALPPRTACITFDDAFRNVFTTAHPILQRRRLPSTVFVVTGLVG